MQGSVDLGAGFDVAGAVDFLHAHSWLAEFRIAEFISEEYWRRSRDVPDSWRIFCDTLALPSPGEDYASRLMDLAAVPKKEAQCDVEKFVQQCYARSFVSAFSGGPSADSQKRRNVKMKKTYEIEKIKDVLLEIKGEALTLVDVGAGQGYLAMELLEADEQIHVVAVESSEIQVHGTLDRLKEQRDSLQERLVLRKAHMRVGAGGAEFNDFVFGSLLPPQPFLMYSLHACGSLSECMIEVFCENDCLAKTMCNIACCYNLIDEHLPGKHFPMSVAVGSLWASHALTRNMKMAACQAPFRWKHRPGQTSNFFKRHFWRALLQKVIIDEVGEGGGLGEPLLATVGNIGNAALGSFVQYCHAAFENVRLDRERYPSVACLEAYQKRYHEQEARLALLWTMRSLLGLVIEALILCDRYFYVRERLPDASVHLWAVLDPFKSPRNIALVAIKN